MIRVLLIDDHERFRDCMAAAIASTPGFVVAGETGLARAALELLAAGLEVDVLLTDMRMPGIDGIELTRRVQALRPGLPVLVLSSHDDPVLVAAAAAAGARGYQRKGAPLETLLQALHDVAAGRSAFAGDQP